jgi:hypothetical protein
LIYFGEIDSYTLAVLIPTLAVLVPTLAELVPTLAELVPTLAELVPTPGVIVLTKQAFLACFYGFSYLFEAFLPEKGVLIGS